jgi:hypothetical protein
MACCLCDLQNILRSALSAIIGIDVKSVIAGSITASTSNRRMMETPSHLAGIEMDMKAQMGLMRTGDLTNQPLALQPLPLSESSAAAAALLGNQRGHDVNVLRRIALEKGYKLLPPLTDDSPHSYYHDIPERTSHSGRPLVPPLPPLEAPHPLHLLHAAHRLHTLPAWCLAAPSHRDNGGRLVESVEDGQVAQERKLALANGLNEAPTAGHLPSHQTYAPDDTEADVNGPSRQSRHPLGAQEHPSNGRALLATSGVEAVILLFGFLD